MEGGEKMNDLIGMSFGKLTVVKFDKITSSNKKRWWCKCECGSITSIQEDNLKSGNSTKCHYCRCVKDLTGNIYGSLTVMKFSYRENHKSFYECQCNCGNTVVVRSDCLTTGNTKSCGCLNNKSKKDNPVTKEKLYHIWYGMKERCYNSNNLRFDDYGGRGITISKCWDSYKSFKNWALENGYKEGLSIDRIDVDGNYEPSNCRWVQMSVQQRNKRNNKYYTYNGKSQLLKDWAKDYGIKEMTLYARINTLHWDFEKAITTPLTNK